MDVSRACNRQGGAGILPGPLGRQDDCRGSASRERNHGVGDHPIPFRTRQLSPTSPKVLRREAAGGQVVPLAGGAFLRLTRPNGMGEPVRQKLYYNFGHLEGCLFCFRRSL